MLDLNEKDKKKLKEILEKPVPAFQATGICSMLYSREFFDIIQEQLDEEGPQKDVRCSIRYYLNKNGVEL